MSGRLILALTVVSAAAIVGLVFWAIGRNEERGRAGARFAEALVENDPGAAPKGGREYITRMRAYFGAVTGARLIGTHNEARRREHEHVPDISGRGPAAAQRARTGGDQLAFDNGGIGSEEVTGVYELEPEDAPSCRHAIASSSRRRLRSVAASRPARRRSSRPPPRPADPLRHGPHAHRRCERVRALGCGRRGTNCDASSAPVVT